MSRSKKNRRIKKGISAKKRSASAGRKRRKKTKKKRHIITRKNKRKRIRTKKRRRGGMPKHNRVEELRSKEKSVFRPLGERDKFKKKTPKKVRFSPLRRSSSVRSDLNAMDMFKSKIRSEQQEQTQAPQLVKMMEDLSVSSETQQPG